MFRIQGIGERPDAVEEKRKTRESVIANIVIFSALLISFRIAPLIIKQLQ